MPVVPCDQLMTGQPPLGALPLGTDTSPETAILPPFSEVDRYRTTDVLPAAVSVFFVSRDQIRSPCLPLSVAGGVYNPRGLCTRLPVARPEAVSRGPVTPPS